MIKFNKHNVTNGAYKARASYHLDNRTDGRKCVTIYAKDYGAALAHVLGDVENNTDSQADYFETSTARIFENNPLYLAARARAEKNHADWQAKHAAKRAA
jgi:hypothetical protein